MCFAFWLENNLFHEWIRCLDQSWSKFILFILLFTINSSFYRRIRRKGFFWFLNRFLPFLKSKWFAIFRFKIWVTGMLPGRNFSESPFKRGSFRLVTCEFQTHSPAAAATLCLIILIVSFSISLSTIKINFSENLSF